MSEREAPKAKNIGKKKYKEWIHKDSKRLDQKNLPFKFSKPCKSKPLNKTIECSKCGRDLFFNEQAVLVTCCRCGELTRVRTIKKKGLFND